MYGDCIKVWGCFDVSKCEKQVCVLIKEEHEIVMITNFKLSRSNCVNMLSCLSVGFEFLHLPIPIHWW